MFEGKLVCVVGKNHPTANKKLTLEDYLKYSHAILPTTLEALPIDIALAKLDHKRKVVKRSPNFVASIMSLQKTSMILSLPKVTVMPLLDAAGLVVHDLPFDVQPMQFSMIWHKRNNDNQPHKWFREELKSVIEEAQII